MVCFLEQYHTNYQSATESIIQHVTNVNTDEIKKEKSGLFAACTAAAADLTF
jgi:hypothetical protein